MWFGSGEDCALLGLLDWSRPKESTIVFSVVLVFLLAVRYVSLLSVIGNLSLALISATMAFRIYKSVLAAVNKSGEGNPFKAYLERDFSLSADRFQQLQDSTLKSLNRVLIRLRSIFLIEDVIESIKFAAGMYLLTVVGRWVNGLTLATLLWLLAFSLPKVYKDNQKSIDEALAPIKQKYEEFAAKMRASLPANVTGAVQKKEE